MRKPYALVVACCVVGSLGSAGVARAQTAPAEVSPEESTPPPERVSPGPAVAPAPQQPPPPPAYHPMPYYPPFDRAPTEEEPAKPRWYGWQTLTTDGAALAAMVLGGVQEEDGDPLIALGLGGYLLGGPIVHLAHRRPGIGLASLGIRAGAPLTGMFIGYAIADCSGRERDFCGVGEAALGLLFGMGAAVAIDAAVLAREPVQKPGRERIWTARPRLVPGVVLTPEKRTLVLTGIF